MYHVLLFIVLGSKEAVAMLVAKTAAIFPRAKPPLTAEPVDVPPKTSEYVKSVSESKLGWLPLTFVWDGWGGRRCTRAKLLNHLCLFTETIRMRKIVREPNQSPAATVNRNLARRGRVSDWSVCQLLLISLRVENEAIELGRCA